jgi:hypothetical protein
MALRSLAAVLLLAACAAGCAGSRPDLHPRLGYEESRLDSTSYIVSFQGNASASHASVRRAVLTRCAELTRASGHDYFILLAIGTTGYQDEMHTPDQATSGRAHASPSVSGAGTATPMDGPVNIAAQVPGEWIQVSRYKTTVTMRMCSGTVPPDNPNAHAVGEFLGTPPRD